MMSHCAPFIGANRIQGTKSRKYILITLAVFVNVISNFFAKLKVIKKKRLRKTVSDCYFMDSCAWASKLEALPLKQSRHDGTFHLMK